MFLTISNIEPAFQMNKNILITLVVLSIASCTSDRKTTEQKNPNDLTPEVLNDIQKQGISSYSKRYEPNIIQELFEEALEKDKDLKTVISTLEKVKKQKVDNLENYQTYIRNNQNYWNALSQYSKQLSDSTLKNELLDLIATLKDKQSTRTSSLEKLIAEIDSTERKLGDLEILMKIMVTAPMMHNYQRNKLPNSQPIESTKQALDSSINSIKPYAEFQK